MSELALVTLPSASGATISASLSGSWARRQFSRVLPRAADDEEVPGFVAVAAISEGVIYEGAFGKRDLAKGIDLTADRQSLSIGSKSQRMARNSKAETCVQLSACGQLSLRRAVQYRLTASIVCLIGVLIWAVTVVQRLPADFDATLAEYCFIIS